MNTYQICFRWAGEAYDQFVEADHLPAAVAKFMAEPDWEGAVRNPNDVLSVSLEAGK